MAQSSSYIRIQRDLLNLVSAIPAGYVTTYADVARYLAVQPRHITYILATLDEADRHAYPWWRVVADGGAIGRHQHRDDQIAGLMNDGVPVSAVGIVQELRDRRVADLASPPAAPLAAPQLSPSGAPARSRGMKSHTKL